MRGSFMVVFIGMKATYLLPLDASGVESENGSEACRIKKRILRDPLLVLLGTKISVKINLWRVARGVIILLYGLDGG